MDSDLSSAPSGRREMERILAEESTGYLGLSSGDEPYVVPLNYVYADGAIIIHCAFTGKKIDLMCANPRVCFAVGRQTGSVTDHGGATSCHVDSDSVICYGTARLVTDVEERRQALTRFNRRFHPEAEGEISVERAEKCNVILIDVQEMTGRKERARTHTHWRYVFPAVRSEEPPECMSPDLGGGRSQ